MKPNKVNTDEAANLLASLQQAAMEGAQQSKDSAKEEAIEEEDTKMELPSKADEGKICYPGIDNDGWMERREELLEFAILQNAGSYSEARINDFEQSLTVYEGVAEDRLAKREREAPDYGHEIPTEGVDKFND